MPQWLVITLYIVAPLAWGLLVETGFELLRRHRRPPPSDRQDGLYDWVI